MALFRKDFFIWKVVTKKEDWEIEIDIFPLLDPEGSDNQGWTKPKPGAWNSIWVSYKGGSRYSSHDFLLFLGM